MLMFFVELVGLYLYGKLRMMFRHPPVLLLFLFHRQFSSYPYVKHFFCIYKQKKTYHLYKLEVHPRFHLCYYLSLCRPH